ncbi:MAG: hypothetical protein CMF26_02455 [Kiloniella sp.]|nr:hypothetical protein [Kiloniella sp.]
MSSIVPDHPDIPDDAPIIGLDHVILAVSDLAAAQAQAQKLGFTTTDITAHEGWGTANTCIMFRGLDDQGDYVEILGVRNSSMGTNGLEDHLAEQGEGMLSLALKGRAEKAAAAFDNHGLDHLGIENLHRNVEVVKGMAQRASFKLVRPQRGPFSPIPLFVCEHLTPRAVWAERFLQHENGTIGIRAVQIRMTPGSKLGEGYEALLTGKLSGSISKPVGADLEFYSADDWAQIYPDPEAHEAIVYQVENLNRTGAFLAESGLAFRPASAGYRGYIVYPNDAGGAYAVFTDGS